MGKADKRWAIRKRAELLEALGAVCCWCGSLENLTFDCISPRGDGHHKGSTDQRMRFYLREHENDNVQVLCGSCNARKGDDAIDFRPLPEMNWEHVAPFPPPF